ncbi:MAG TPA: hypothetical protein DEA50_04195 [Parvularcula sp.]|nr:hypothetical protein [Parvularcula sp.]
MTQCNTPQSRDHGAENNAPGSQLIALEIALLDDLAAVRTAQSANKHARLSRNLLRILRGPAAKHRCRHPGRSAVRR